MCFVLRWTSSWSYHLTRRLYLFRFSDFSSSLSPLRCRRAISFGWFLSILRKPSSQVLGSFLTQTSLQHIREGFPKKTVRRHFVPRTNCPTALCTSPETYCPNWCTLPGDILSHFLNMNPHTLGKACAYLRHILDISWAIFGHICGIYVRKPLFNWHF